MRAVLWAVGVAIYRRCLLPQAIIIDEIGTEAECQAARTIAQRGVQLVATAHGNALENVIKNPALNLLVGGIQVWLKCESQECPPLPFFFLSFCF